jgi:hypothetical protein
MSFTAPKVKGSIQVGQTVGGLPGFVSVPVGANGTVLTADSALDPGVKWAVPAAGGGTLGFRSVAASGALLTTDANKVILATGGGGGITLTLPDPALVIGTPIYVKKVDAGVGAVTVAQFAGETIDGATSIGIASQYQEVTFVSDGTNWHLI